MLPLFDLRLLVSVGLVFIYTELDLCLKGLQSLEKSSKKISSFLDKVSILQQGRLDRKFSLSGIYSLLEFSIYF